jgi:hypothetical protein
MLTAPNQTEAAHQGPKSYFARGSKKTKSFILEATQLDRAKEHIARIGGEFHDAGTVTGSKTGRRKHRMRNGPTALAMGDLSDQYHIGRTQDNWVELGNYVNTHPGDPALTVSDHMSPMFLNIY